MAGDFSNILIVGTGLIGGSLAGALKERLPELRVYGADSDVSALRAARAAGLIEPEDITDSDFRGIDLVVLASPIETFEFWFRALDSAGYTGAITDTASAKLPVIRAAKKTLKDPSKFIPGHPMAGREKNGIASAKSDLFEGAYWILTPDAARDTELETYRKLHALITALGARVIAVDPAEHDRLVAVVSHVPHVAASALAMLAASHSGANGELMRLAGAGFKDTTRIATGNPELWAGILASNDELIADELAALTRILGDFERGLRTGDTEKLRQLLSSGADARRSIPQKWASESAELKEVHVYMNNRPGAIATITAEAGRRACNIGAIDIDHQTDSHAILRLILTDEGDIDGFVTALIGHGFDAEVVTTQ